MDEIRYVSKVGRDAWLRVRLDTSGEISLPQYLKVRLVKTQSDRDFFEILEGPYKGKRGNFSRKSPVDSYLLKGAPHQAAGTVRFDRTQQAFGMTTKDLSMRLPGSSLVLRRFQRECMTCRFPTHPIRQRVKDTMHSRLITRRGFGSVLVWLEAGSCT